MPLKTQQDEAPALNLTPMIDVVFLLIIFFMVATKFGELERNLEVAVPEVADAGDGTPALQPWNVTVFSDGRIELQSEPVALDELTARLAAARSQQGEPPVVIRGDAECAFQHIAAVLAACRAANVSELGITVRVAGLGGTGSER